MEVPDHPISGHCVDDFHPGFVTTLLSYLPVTPPKADIISHVLAARAGEGEVWVLQRLEKCPRMAVGVEG